VMPLDRMPSISLGIIVHVGTRYDASYHWRNEAGELRASVGFDAGGYSNAHLQGPPAALRELAAALIEAAELAERADDPADVGAAVTEGVAL
jgi:major membrane immunogen (membrane-anchored lipoprotein)